MFAQTQAIPHPGGMHHIHTIHTTYRGTLIHGNPKQWDPEDLQQVNTSLWCPDAKVIEVPVPKESFQYIIELYREAFTENYPTSLIAGTEM